MNFLKSILIVLCFLFLSCNDNVDDLVTNLDESKQINKKVKKEIIITNKTSYNSSFKKKLEWVSYISAQVIGGNNQAALNELQNKLNGRNKISLKELLGSQVPNNSPFKLAFINILSGYIRVDLNPRAPGPVHGNQSPPRPITVAAQIIIDSDFPSGTSVFPSPFPKPNPTITVEALANSFINQVTIHNCVELYFPRGLKLSLSGNLNSIISTAHPLNNDGFNTGYLQFKQLTLEDEIDALLGEFNNTFLVNSNFLSNKLYHNIIVARPYRDTDVPFPSNCSYSNYLIDFTTFLRN